MGPHLPKVIADYFETDRTGSAEEVAAFFTEDAVVRDEKRTHVGRDAIREWKANASSEYNYTTEPFAIADSAGRKVVTSRLVGDFPGSPVDLRYFFVLDGDRIADLEIVP
ncbi:nuclear transport factor 2 family protein [Georhizobium sp. MAB10]|uniref:nuclear transport factor 2 family protein n=1 Tax=Georhizobium sp. MAB10 TaxID=3028319 RepID=UPI0038559428